MRWISVSSDSFTIPNNLRLLLKPKTKLPNPFFYGRFDSQTYCYCPTGSSDIELVNHCSKGLHLLFYKNRSLKSGTTERRQVNYPESYVSFDERATITEETWMRANIMDTILTTF